MMIMMIVALVLIILFVIYLFFRLNDLESYIHESLINRISVIEKHQLVIPRIQDNIDLAKSIETGYKLNEKDNC